MSSDPSSDPSNAPLRAPLPSQIDVRKLAVKGVEIKAEVPVSRLVRFVDSLASDSSVLAVDLHFYVDEERFRRIDGRVRGTVEVYCQRCLEPMPLELDTEFSLGIVWSEDDARRLPDSLDPLIVGEELTDLADVLSEELILSLPYVSYHAAEDCKQTPNYSVGAEESVAQVVVEKVAERENPFKVLEQLKRDK